MSIPNLISLARLLSAPLTVYLLLQGLYTAAFWLFVAAGVSDAVDGFLAKRLGMASELGAYLDPLADKALLVSVYWTLGAAGLLAVWLVILVVFRDIIIITGLVLLKLNNQESMRMRPMMISKVNTAAQITLAAVLLAELGLPLDTGLLLAALIYLVAATTLISGGIYLVNWARHVASLEEGGR
jgi:cardiolipin synthase